MRTVFVFAVLSFALIGVRVAIGLSNGESLIAAVGWGFVVLGAAIFGGLVGASIFIKR